MSTSKTPKPKIPKAKAESKTFTLDIRKHYLREAAQLLKLTIPYADMPEGRKTWTDIERRLRDYGHPRKKLYDITDHKAKGTGFIGLIRSNYWARRARPAILSPHFKDERFSKLSKRSLSRIVDCLGSAFCWSDTVEGNDYWANLYEYISALSKLRFYRKKPIPENSERSLTA